MKIFNVNSSLNITEPSTNPNRLREDASPSPPPEFESALRNSVAISYITIEDDPPPTYEEYLKAHDLLKRESSNPTPTTLNDVKIQEKSYTFNGDGDVL